MTRSLTITLFLVLGSFGAVQAQDHRDEAKAFFVELVRTYFARGNNLYRLHRDSLLVIEPSRIYVHRQVPSHIGDTVVPDRLLPAWVRQFEGGIDPRQGLEVRVFPYKAFTQKRNASMAAALGSAKAFAPVMNAVAKARRYFTKADWLFIAKAGGKTYPVIARRDKKGWKIAAVFNLPPASIYGITP